MNGYRLLTYRDAGGLATAGVLVDEFVYPLNVAIRNASFERPQSWVL